VASIAELIPGFKPENELERKLVEDPELREGLAWGEPRKGHPEGSVGAHVGQMLEALDRDPPDPERRSILRIVALLHDSMKYRVQDWRPKVRGNHHATRARRFAEGYTNDDRILTTVEHHDRPYNIWRKMRRTGRLDEERFSGMLSEIPDMPLFLRFVELDGSTEGKDPEPIEWFRGELRRRGLIGEGAGR
jgi:hypothetical protein